MLENSLTGEPPSCGVATRGRIGTTIRQMAHPSSRPNLDKSERTHSALKSLAEITENNRDIALGAVNK